jgi:hypothetical protein
VTSDAAAGVVAKAQRLGISFRVAEGRVWVKLPQNHNPGIDALITKIRANRMAIAEVLRFQLAPRLEAAMPKVSPEAAPPLKVADPATQERMKASQRQFGKIHARLFPLIGRQIWTPLGTGKLLSVFHDRCEVLLDSAEQTVRVRPSDVRAIQ